MVVLPPRLDRAPGIAEVEDPVPVETLVAEPSMNALDEVLPNGLARFDVAEHRPPRVGLLSAVPIAADVRRMPVTGDNWGAA